LSYANSNLSAASIDALSDVTITSAANGDFLRWNGTAWVNDAVNLSTDTVGSYVESLVAGTGITLTNNSGEAATPTVTVDTTVIAPLANPTFTGTVVLPDNTVALGTKTTGDYVSSLVAGTGVTLTNNSGEGSTPTISIGQAVGTSASVTFADITVAGNLTVSGTTTSIATETLTVDDNIVVLNNNATGAPSQNAGIEIERGSSANVSLRWNETHDTWEITTDGSNYGTIATTGDVSSAAGAITVDNLSDVVITSAANKDFLMYNGTNWVDQAITLGTDTTGDYVATLTAGTGITLASNSGEGSSPTVTVDTSVIQARVTNVTDTEIGYLDGVTSAIQTQIDLKAPLASPTFTGTPTLPTGTIATTQTASNNTTAVATTAYVDAADALKANLASPTFTGTPTLPTGTIATTQTPSNNTTAVATTAYVDAADALKAPLASPTFTGAVTLPDNTVELGTKTTGNYVATITGGTGVTSSAATTGEGTTHSLSIGQAVGTTDNVTFAGVTADAITIGVTAAGEIDTTSGNLTIDSAGGTVTIDDNLTVTGNLTVSGTTTSINTATLNVADNVVVLNNDVTGSPTENAGIEVERGTSANVLVRYNETSDKWEATNDGTTYGNLVTTADSGTVTSTMIADGTILNADINASAAIALSKLATSTAGNIIVYNASGVPTSVAETGDITISDTGVTAIATEVIVNADISATAAIELGKLADVSTSAQTASYTLVLADKNKIVEMLVATANTLTVPPNASVAYPVGAQINILQTGAGQTTVTAGAGVTINASPGLKLRTQWSYATLVKRATNTWVLVGDISA
jgi:hypothetical protein